MKKHPASPQTAPHGEKSATPVRFDLEAAFLSPLRRKIDDPGKFVIDEGVTVHHQDGTTAELYRMARYRKGKLRQVETTFTTTRQVVTTTTTARNF